MRITRKKWTISEELEEAIRAAIGISDDHFLKLNEQETEEYIETALEVLDREEPGDH